MSDSKDAGTSKQVPGKVVKLPPIPKGAKLHKRPFTRRQPPASMRSRIIYVSSGTPFMSVVRRARKQLDEGLQGRTRAAHKNASLGARVQALRSASEASSPSSPAAAAAATVVTVMGTGKAVEKTLSVASWFEQQDDCEVALRTKTVGTVDDVVLGENEDGDVEDESRVRRMSCLEVTLKLK